MEYIRFENEELNQYFKERTQKDKFALEDLKSLDNIELGYINIESNDLRVLLQLNKKIKTEFGISFHINSISPSDSEILEECTSNKSLNNIEGDIWIQYNSFEDMTEEQLEYLLSRNNQNIQVDFSNYKGAKTDIVKKLKDKGNIKIGVGRYNDVDTILDMTKAMNEIENIIPENASEIEKFLIIYRTLSMAIKYDKSGNSVKNKKDNEFTRSSEGVLLYGRGVCVGYAKTLKEVLNYFHIDANFQSCDDPPHEWNQVKIDGQWYNVDLTWDDDFLKKGFMPIYCLLNDEDFYKNHSISTGIYQEKCLESYPRGIIKEILQQQIQMQKGIYKTKGKGIPKLIGKEQYKCNALGRRVEKSRILAMMRTIIAENKRDTEERTAIKENKVRNLFIRNDDLYR